MWKIELHAHTNFSPCSSLSPEKIIKTCEKKNIQAIAITDHNSLQGALKVKNLAPKNLFIIVGSEICTSEGEITGYFLSREIAPFRPVEETMHEIKKQGGLIGIPHPADPYRKKALSFKTIETHKNLIDCIEIFNSRTVSAHHANIVQQFVKKIRLPYYVGSDAHFSCEIGKSFMLIKPWGSPQEFLKNLQCAETHKSRSGIHVHLYTKIHKIIRKYHHQTKT